MKRHAQVEPPETGTGRKIIEGLREALRGDFASVTIDGVRWERVDHEPGPSEADVERVAKGLAESSGYGPSEWPRLKTHARAAIIAYQNGDHKPL